MPVFLRIAAVLALIRAAALFFLKPIVLGSLAGVPSIIALANGLALANLGLAFLFWRGGGNPRGERTAIYTAMIVTGGRMISGTYETLYLLEGNGGVISLIDMIANVALMVGMVNSLPRTLGVEPNR